MGKIGRISLIPRNYSNEEGPSLQQSLQKGGYTRTPGTGEFFMPFSEVNGKYRTGLDPDSTYINRLRESNPEEAKKESERTNKLREHLESLTQLKLDARSKYYNYKYGFRGDNEGSVSIVKMRDGENIYNLDDPFQYITFLWLREHPRIARSLEAYNRGEYGFDIQYYVNDEDVTAATEYAKKKGPNDAMKKFDSYSIEKRKRVARLLGIGIGEDPKEEVVYNAVDDFIRSKTIAVGPYAGRDPVRVFGEYADLDDDVLEIKDLVNSALRTGLYKEGKGGKIYQGELERFTNKGVMTEFYLDDKNQPERIILTNQIKAKMLAK